VPLFLGLIVLFKVQKHGFRVRRWGPEKSNDLSGAILASSEKRKGRLEFPDNGLTRDNMIAFVTWVWAWMK
jgi:amino acid transporter